MNDYREDYIIHYGVKGMKWKKHIKKMAEDEYKLGRKTKRYDKLYKKVQVVTQNRVRPGHDEGGKLQYDDGFNEYATLNNMNTMMRTNKLNRASDKEIRKLARRCKGYYRNVVRPLKKITKEYEKLPIRKKREYKKFYIKAAFDASYKR